MSADSIVTLGHSSPTAIIVAWALSAFIPLPLIVLVLIFHYHSKASIKSILKRLFHHRAASGHQRPSTPSSRTLAGSDDSPRSPPPQVIPSKTGLVDHVYFSPSTPRNWVATLPESPRTDQASQHSKASPRNRDSSGNNVGNPHSPSLRNPRRLGFLESRSLPSTRRNDSYACLPSDNGLEHSQPKAEEPSPASYGLQHRRMKHRCVISFILSVVVLLLYVLEGFTIVAAQRYANVRVLSQPNGNGGLGQGKEDEKWLIPWAVYLLIQGGLVVLCVHTVWAMKRQVNDLEVEWAKEKGKGVARSSNDGPKEDALRDIELQPMKSGREEDRLVSNDGDDSGMNSHDKGKGKERQVKDEDAEDADWETLGFRPTYDSLDPPNPPFANTYHHADAPWEDCNPYGEGSSNHSRWSSGLDSGRHCPLSSLPVSFLPDNSSESQNVYLHTNRQDWGLRSDNNDEQGTAAERRNSWAEEEEEEKRFQSVNERSREPTPPDQPKSRVQSGPPALPS
ncbi:MAG: hypothetical protein Q9212_006534, partial [Teloschistes hypoglaucus]